MKPFSIPPHRRNCLHSAPDASAQIPPTLSHSRHAEVRLSELISYHLYDLQDGYVNIDNKELCETLEVDRCVADAVQIVKSWGWDFKWREGEDWMGDAQALVVKGSVDLDWLP